MLRAEERRAVQATFGAADAQVRRDHLLSHVIAAVAQADGEWVLYGGTGLARTHLPSFRLSEDLDLLAHPRTTAVAELTNVVTRRLRREFGAVQWQPPLSVAPENAPVVLRTDDGLAVRVQVGELDADRRRWPVEARDMVLRYADVEPAQIAVPTLPAFVAMKTAAWEDRHAARDLADLAALASLGAVDREAVSILRTVTGRTVHSHLFNRLPARTISTWATQLAHQLRDLPDPEECLDNVRLAFERATGRARRPAQG
jgi:predicted nucleotidyltransferase component of viral defense system